MHVLSPVKNWESLGRGLVTAGAALIVGGAIMSSAGFADDSAPTAQRVVTGGHLDWQYAPDGDAGTPSVTLGEGVTQPAAGVLRFPVSDGTYDAATGEVTVRHRGSVRLAYRDRTATLNQPVVVIDDAGAVLRATVAGRSAELLGLETFGLPPATSKDQVIWEDVSTALTPEGARTLDAGAGDGQVDLVLTVAQLPGPEPRVALPAPAATSPSASASPSSTPTGSPSPSEEPSDCPSPSVTPSASGSPSGSPSASPSASSTATEVAVSTSPSNSTSPSPTGSGSPTPSPSSCSPSPGPSTSPSGSSSPSSPTSPNSPDGGNLPKTGDALFLPMTVLGSLLVTAGGGTILAARRRLDEDA